MEKSLLEKNLEQISRYNKKLAEQIANHNEFNCDFEFVEAKTADIILSHNGILLHDDIDPQEEAFNIFKSVPQDNKSSIHVLFGLGLGYLFKRFSMSAKGKIIVFEPSLDILRLTLESTDLSDDLKKNSVIIINSREDFQACFEKFYYYNTEVSLSFLSSYGKIYPDLLKELIDELGFLKGLFGSSYENLTKKCNLWTLSGMLNIPEVIKNKELEALREKFKNKPAVIVSAGPSLDKNIATLKEFKDNAVIFCVGNAAKTAASHNIKPDFIVMVEHNDCTFQVAGVDMTDTNLILPPVTFNRFHTMETKRKFNYYPNNDFTTKWLAEIINMPLNDYHNKGTVSISALFSAKILGCNPIIVIGQDLAYTNGNCYSQKSTYKNFKIIKNSQTGEFEVTIENYEEFLENMNPYGNIPRELLESEAEKRIDQLQKSLYSVKGHDGEMIPTESGYATFIRYFENAASEFGKETKFINSTEGGAYLEGFEHIPLKESLQIYAKEKIDVESIIQDSLKTSRNLYKEKNEIVREKYSQMINLIELTIEYMDAGLEHSKKLEKLFNLKRFSDDSVKKHVREIVNCFLKIDEIAKSNQVILGLIFPQYSKFSAHINNANDFTGIESIEELINFGNQLFLLFFVLEQQLVSIKEAAERFTA